MKIFERIRNKEYNFIREVRRFSWGGGGGNKSGENERVEGDRENEN